MEEDEVPGLYTQTDLSGDRFTDYLDQNYDFNTVYQFDPKLRVFSGLNDRQSGIGDIIDRRNPKIYLRDVISKIPKKPMLYAAYDRRTGRAKFGMSSKDGRNRLKHHGKYWGGAELVGAIAFDKRQTKRIRGIETEIKKHMGVRSEFIDAVQLPTLLDKMRKFRSYKPNDDVARRKRLRTLRPRASTRGRMV
jgi:hypothetical protein